MFDMIMTEAVSWNDIADRHVSLGKALEANDLQWARAYQEQAGAGRGLTADQASSIFYKSLGGMTPETADFLLELGADPTLQHKVTLPDRQEIVGLARLLIDNGNQDLFCHLFEQGKITLADRSVGGDGLLAQALAKGNLELAQWLFDRKARLDEANFLGMTALHQSANRMNFLSVEWLMEHGANPELETLEESSVPAQLIPEMEDDGEADLLFEALEDYSQSFAQGRFEVPAALRAHCDRLRQEALEEAQENEDSQRRRQRGPR